MPIPENIKEMAADLHAAAERDLTPSEWKAVLKAKAQIRKAVDAYGEAGQVALSLCAADFAAE